MDTALGGGPQPAPQQPQLSLLCPLPAWILGARLAEGGPCPQVTGKFRGGVNPFTRGCYGNVEHVLCSPLAPR